MSRAVGRTGMNKGVNIFDRLTDVLSALGTGITASTLAILLEVSRQYWSLRRTGCNFASSVVPGTGITVASVEVVVIYHPHLPRRRVPVRRVIGSPAPEIHSEGPL